MMKRYVLGLVLIVFSVVLVYQPVLAKEDTAQITLKKTAISKKKLYTYTVQEGDDIANIIKSIPGVTEKNLSRNYQLIKELNPDVEDIDNMEAGQILVLPGKPSMAMDEESPIRTTRAASKTSLTTENKYKIKKGDSLIKIIYRELGTSTNIPKTLRIIKSMNPGIKNVNRIYAGDVIKLPGKTAFVKTPDETEEVSLKPTQIPAPSDQSERIIEIKEKAIMSAEARLDVIKQVITQMNGSITTTGNYYLPIPKTGQVTLDCSKIPVIDFDDGTTIFLDLENRAHNNLRKLIRDNWTNYHLIKVNKNDDVIALLRKVINSSKNYSMNKSVKPVVVGSLPPVEIMIDWVISSTVPKHGQSIKQGLRLIYENNPLLPKTIKNYSQKNNFIITEISEATGIVGKPEEAYSIQPMPILPTASAGEFAYALVSFLELKAERDVDIQIFETIRDGFNLSIKADVLVQKDNKKYLIYSQTMPQQFTSNLTQSGNELIYVSPNDAPRINMEKILRGLNISFTHEIYKFSGLEKNQAPYTLNFNATKVKTDKDFYIVDFNMDQEVRNLLSEVWSANIAKYY